MRAQQTFSGADEAKSVEGQLARRNSHELIVHAPSDSDAKRRVSWYGRMVTFRREHE